MSNLPTTTATIDLIEIVKTNERVLAKLDQIIEGQKAAGERVDRLESRIAAVETQVRHYKSVIATLSAAVGLAGGIIVPWIREKVGL